jgi:hypothetical protein
MAVRVVDHFILNYRLPDGSTAVDRFLAGRESLTASGREMPLGGRDPVEGVFEVERRDGDAVILLDPVDGDRQTPRRPGRRSTRIGSAS